MEFKPSYMDSLVVDIQPSYANSLMHHGIKGQKWGVRRFQNADGSYTNAGSKRRKKLSLTDKKYDILAKRDAKEFARAKMSYGEGAGNRRKLIKAKVAQRRKENEHYDAVFDEYLDQEDLSKHADAAKRERVAKDTVKSTKKAARTAFRVANTLAPLLHEDYSDESYLVHHGIKGQKWGVRRFETNSGRLTDAGKKRYSIYDDVDDKMKPSTSDSVVTKRAKKDWQNLSEMDFRRKYSVSKRKYAKRVAKSPTGDPYADVRAEMTKNGPSKKFDKAVEKEARQMGSVHLAEKAEKVRDSRSLGSRIVSTLLTGARGDTAYNTARAAGYSKTGSTLSTAILGSEATMNIADATYKNSREGRSYINRTRNSYYN